MPILTKELYLKSMKKYGLELHGSKSIFNYKEGLTIELPALVQSNLDEIRHVGAYSIIRSGGRATNAKVGRYCSIGPGVYMGAPEHDINYLGVSSIFSVKYGWISKDEPFPLGTSLIEKPTVIMNDVWIGNGSYIKPGITIGNGAVIGARSVVTKNVAPYTVVAGNPARVIKKRFSDKVIEDLLELNWWDYNSDLFRKIDHTDVESSISYMKDNIDNFEKMNPPKIVINENSFDYINGDEVTNYIIPPYKSSK